MNDERETMNGGKADIFPDDDDRVFFLRLRWRLRLGLRQRANVNRRSTMNEQ
jgi:hypothetical protein